MSIDVAIGVVDGQVVAKWHQATNEIVFDPQNAYQLGVSMARAAMEAHRGSKNNAAMDSLFLQGELGQQRIKITDAQRTLLINQVATMIRTLRNKNRSDGYIAMHAVDAVLTETAQ